MRRKERRGDDRRVGWIQTEELGWHLVLISNVVLQDPAVFGHVFTD